ncbi:hypothetical protein [Streptomyces sp. NPDC059371]|uniref:hypothetical protein n=1 Tax=Streptomyces sp. NPDC059371 TaxID=3346812 RepID=UPI0036C3AE9A
MAASPCRRPPGRLPLVPLDGYHWPLDGYRWSPLNGVGTAPVRAADGRAVAGEDACVDARVADGVRVSVGTAVVRAVGTVLGAGVRREGPLAPGRGLTGPGETDGVGSADGLLAGGGASGTTGDTGASGAADRSGSTTRAPRAHATAAPAAARSSRRRAAPRRIAS